MLSLYAKWKPNKNNPAYHNKDQQKNRVRDSSHTKLKVFADGQLVDVEWTARYQEEMKANEDLERILKDRLQVMQYRS